MLTEAWQDPIMTALKSAKQILRYAITKAQTNIQKF